MGRNLGHGIQEREPVQDPAHGTIGEKKESSTNWIKRTMNIKYFKKKCVTCGELSSGRQCSKCFRRRGGRVSQMSIRHRDNPLLEEMNLVW